MSRFVPSLQEIWILVTKISTTTQISSLISTHPRQHLIVVATVPKQNYYCDDTYSHRYMSLQIGRRENFPQARNGGNPFETRCYFFATRIPSPYNFSNSNDNSHCGKFVSSLIGDKNNNNIYHFIWATTWVVAKETHCSDNIGGRHG